MQPENKYASTSWSREWKLPMSSYVAVYRRSFRLVWTAFHSYHLLRKPEYSYLRGIPKDTFVHESYRDPSFEWTAYQPRDSASPLTQPPWALIDAVRQPETSLTTSATRRSYQILTTIAQPGQASLNQTAHKMLPAADDPSWWHDTRSGDKNSLLPNGSIIHEMTD